MFDLEVEVFVDPAVTQCDWQDIKIQLADLLCGKGPTREHLI